MKHLWTKRSYKDFEFIADWRWTGKGEKREVPVILPNGAYKLDDNGERVMTEIDYPGDSGILLRGNRKSQVNIWNWPIGSGEVYGYRNPKDAAPKIRAGVTPLVRADKPIGQWNRFRIKLVGETLTVWLNGQLVIDEASLPGVPEEGPIGLQHHGDPIEFACLYIKEL